MTDPIQHLRKLLNSSGLNSVRIDEYGCITATGISKYSAIPVCGVSLPCGSVDGSHPGNKNAALIVAAINALPALLEVAEAARDFTHLRTNGDPQGGRGMTKAAVRMEQALAKLEAAK